MVILREATHWQPELAVVFELDLIGKLVTFLNELLLHIAFPVFGIHEAMVSRQNCILNERGKVDLALANEVVGNYNILVPGLNR